MADYTWPTALEPTSFEASLVPNVRQLSSPLSGAGQVLDLVGERWRFTVGLPQSARVNSGALEAYLNKLKGGANRALLWHMARPSIAGSLVSTATLNGAHAQGAASLVLAGAYPANNLLRFVEQFDNAAWTKNGVITVTANSTTAPDGNTTADTLTKGTTSTASWADLTQSLSVGAGGNVGKTYTGSIWLRCASGTVTATLIVSDVAFNSMTLPVVVTTTWQRFSFTSSGPSGAWNSGGSLIGFGLVLPNSTSVFAWGAQLETGSMTAYTPLANLDAGDMIGLSGMLLQVSDDATADTAGAMTVPLVTRLRKAVTGGTGLTLTKPTAAFRPVDTGGIVVGHAGRIVREVSIEFLEDY